MAAKKRGKKKFIVIGIIALVILAVIILRPRDAAERAYTAVQAETGDISVDFSFTGSITAPSSQTITAPSNSTVRDLYVEANQQVAKNDRIMRLDDGSVLKAELDGEITLLTVKTGDYVSSGRTLTQITDMNRLEVEISIDEYDVDAVELGKPVDVYITALDVHCDGTIAAFDKQADTTGQIAYYNAMVSIDTPEGVLPGMQVEVTLTRESAKDAVLIKAAAIQFTQDNKPYVLVDDGKGVKTAQSITTGINDGTNVQILDGLKAGDTVYYIDKSTTDFFAMSIAERRSAMTGGQ